MPGRVAHQEADAYDLYWAETEVRRADGTLLFSYLLRLNARDVEGPVSIGLRGPSDVLAALNVVVLCGIVKVFRGMQTGSYSEAELEHTLSSRG